MEDRVPAKSTRKERFGSLAGQEKDETSGQAK